MKTEEIAKKARELYPKETIIPMVDINGNPFETSFFVNNWIDQKRYDYAKGYMDCNAEWKEKTENLINALQNLMDGVAGLPPLSTTAGVLEKQYKQAEQAIKNVKLWD